jgi:hypothetical protein
MIEIGSLPGVLLIILYRMFANRRCAVYLTLWLAGLVGQAATYYVDSQAGDDARLGTTLRLAWKSLERVNQTVFQAGDKILFKSGARYIGQLKPQGSGQLVKGKPLPIIIGKYGAGPKPRIDGQFLDALLLRNVEFWEIEDLEITNLGANRAPWRTGVHIITDGFGKMRHIYLRRLHVHDVNGDLSKRREGCGIYFESRGANQSHFDDLRIENCHVVRTDRNGICQRTSSGARSLRVVIRGNLLEDIGGDCIKPWGSNGALVEHNVVRGGRMRCDDYAAGIWPFDCDDTVIQFNEVSGIKGIKDGQAFDSDYRCRRSLFQYNYSHDNEGGFMLICAPGASYNEGTVIRYNISQNDGVNAARVFHFGGGAKDTLIHNNTIYIGPQQDLPLFLFTEWDKGNPQNTRIFNNVFYVDGRVTNQWGKSTGNVFKNNVFFGNHANLPEAFGSITNRPPLVQPGSGKDGFASLGGYKLRKGAALGVLVPQNGGRDFFGHRVPPDKPPAIGAVQMP